MRNDNIYMAASVSKFLAKHDKNFIDESSHAFFRGAQVRKKYKNGYCYKCSKFEKRFLVPFNSSKMIPREKYKKNKNQQIELLAPLKFQFAT